MNVYDRARAGEYEPTLEYPTRPKEPAVLRKAVKELSDDELQAAIEEREAYRAALDANIAARAAYNSEENRLHAQFRADLEVEYEVVGHPKADKLFAMAWEEGHSSGFAEVALRYDELVGLIK